MTQQNSNTSPCTADVTLTDQSFTGVIDGVEVTFTLGYDADGLPYLVYGDDVTVEMPTPIGVGTASGETLVFELCTDGTHRYYLVGVVPAGQ
jgi:hypothetical protein